MHITIHECRFIQCILGSQIRYPYGCSLCSGHTLISCYFWDSKSRGRFLSAKSGLLNSTRNWCRTKQEKYRSLFRCGYNQTNVSWLFCWGIAFNSLINSVSEVWSSKFQFSTGCSRSRQTHEWGKVQNWHSCLANWAAVCRDGRQSQL